MIAMLLASPCFPYIVLTFLVWLTYGYALKCGFVSDDIPGILQFDGKLQVKGEPKPGLTASRPRIVNSEYGMISRWLRYHFAGGDFPSRFKSKNPDGSDGPPIPQGKIAIRHHILPIALFNVGVGLLYHWLCHITTPTTALMAVSLFVVHPIGTQAIAWCSAIGYPLCLFWIACTLNYVEFAKTLPPQLSLVGLAGFCFLQFLGIHAMFTAMMLWAVLAFFGYWQFAIFGFIISVFMGLDIIKQTIDHRVAEFKKQQMGESTSLHWRKIIVALKTFYYYVKHIVFPARMGLYHTWGFHYSKDLEREDEKMFMGLLLFSALTTAFFVSASIEIKLSILWLVSFLCIFLNWITIQQFITERYAFIPSFGLCLALAYLTRNCQALYYLIFGGYLVRTWMQLPTYDNELRFYQSNHWQFPDSEVALGNLGVTYMNHGLQGASTDAWKIGITINPDYDVSWYNLFSTMRSEALTMISHGDYDNGIGKLNAALPLLKKCLEAKSCHFPDMWKKEYAELSAALKNPVSIIIGERKRLHDLFASLQRMLSQTSDHERISEITSSINDTERQIAGLDAFLTTRGLVKAITTENLLTKIIRGE